MKHFGLFLITIGFLGGALVGSFNQEQVDWRYFLPCLAVGIIGVVLAQTARRREATHEDTLNANAQQLDAAIRRIAENIRKLDDDKLSVDVYEIPQRIDDLFATDLNEFVEARESLIHLYGLSEYAEVMGVFAAGERYLNRVWSAAAEGYIDEVHTYLERARTQFLQAHQKLEALQTQGASA